MLKRVAVGFAPLRATFSSVPVNLAEIPPVRLAGDAVLRMVRTFRLKQMEFAVMGD
jgi:hypothetical protein